MLHTHTFIISIVFLSLVAFTSPSSTTKNETSLGFNAYTEQCARCHGKNGKLMAAGAKDLTSSTLNEEELLQAIQKGSPQRGMPAYEKVLDTTEIKAVVDYVKTFRTK